MGGSPEQKPLGYHAAGATLDNAGHPFVGIGQDARLLYGFERLNADHLAKSYG